MQRLHAPASRAEPRRQWQRGERGEEVADRAAGPKRQRRPHDADLESVDRAQRRLALALAAEESRRVAGRGAQGRDVDETADAGDFARRGETARAVDMRRAQIVDAPVAAEPSAIDDDFDAGELFRQRLRRALRDVEIVAARRRRLFPRLGQRRDDAAADESGPADQECPAHERSPRKSYYL